MGALLEHHPSDHFCDAPAEACIHWMGGFDCEALPRSVEGRADPASGVRGQLLKAD
ncbi:hypothetical protein SBA3_1420025 [Candidatus Sulfopaludibacter sp. SbA3]|nr:hypothetical protein SBA3_1420025 [Candidatus Sulfopaludibacter sp. SbA3]